MRYFAFCVALLVGLMHLSPAFAADYPTKPIQVISPFGAGGDSDLTARVWADFAKKKLGQPVIVVNKTGGGGITGTLFASKAKPDGYTLFLAQAGPSLVLPQIAKVGYHFENFEYIARIMRANCAVVVNQDAPWNNLREFAEAAKKEPNKLIFATKSATTWLTLVMRNFQTNAGIRLKQVEYQSAAEAATAVLGKHADITFLFPQNYVPMVKAGRLKILAIGTKSDIFPNAPTFAELGFKGNYYGWGGIAVPKGTPPEIIAKLAAVTKEISQDPDFIRAIENMGAIPDATAGTEFKKQLDEQYIEMTNAIKTVNIVKK